MIRFGDTQVNLETCEVRHGDTVTPLTPAEVSLLNVLLERAPGAVSRRDLLVEALGYAERAQTRAVDHAIARLRKKLEADHTNPEILLGVRGVGYRLELPPEAATAQTDDPDLVGRLGLLAALRREATGVHVLHGTGGIGKSRLARAWLLGRGSGHFVPLADTTDLPGALREVARTLDLTLQGPASTHVEQVRTRLDQHAITHVALDNLEQLPDDVTRTLVQAVRGPERAVLLTSRHRISDLDAQTVAVPPLSLEDAVTLYERRVQSRIPGYRLTDDQRSDLETFLHAVDRLPLAIELAASRADLLRPADLARRSDRLGALKGTPSEHASGSLNGCIQMSWDLVDATTRSGWLTAAAFEGGFDVEAFEGVADVADPLETLQDLLDRALIHVDRDADGPRRFTWMVSLRTFAQNKLQESPEADGIRDRHLAHFAQQSRDRKRSLEATGDHTWGLRERRNLRAAADWGLSNRRPEVVEVLKMLEVVYQHRGPADERLAVHQQAMNAAGDWLPAADRAQVQSRYAMALIGCGRAEDALSEVQMAHDRLSELAEPADRARLHMAYGTALMHLGRWAESVDVLGDCIREAAACSDGYLCGLGLYNRSYATSQLGDIAQAIHWAQDAMAHLRSAQASRMVLAAQTLVATLQREQGQVEAALHTLASDEPDLTTVTDTIVLDHQATLASILVELGRTNEALPRYSHLLSRTREMGLPLWEADLRTQLAQAMLRNGDAAAALTEASRASAEQRRLGRAEQAGLADGVCAEAQAVLSASG